MIMPEGGLELSSPPSFVSYGFYYRVKRIECIKRIRYTHSAHTASERSTANYFVGYIRLYIDPVTLFRELAHLAARKSSDIALRRVVLNDLKSFDRNLSWLQIIGLST
jgi:hypothetical protein